MDSIIINALKKKRKLESELLRIDAFLDTYEELSGNKIIRDELLSTPDKLDSQNELPADLVDSPKRRNNLKKLLAVASRLIREAGRPLTRGEIVEGMDRLNVTIHAADKSKYIGTLLWRNQDMFRSSGGDGYELVETILTEPLTLPAKMSPLPPLSDKAEQSQSDVDDEDDFLKQ